MYDMYTVYDDESNRYFFRIRNTLFTYHIDMVDEESARRQNCTLVSIPKELYLDIADCTGKQRNAAMDTTAKIQEIKIPADIADKYYLKIMSAMIAGGEQDG